MHQPNPPFPTSPFLSIHPSLSLSLTDEGSKTTSSGSFWGRDNDIEARGKMFETGEVQPPKLTHLGTYAVTQEQQNVRHERKTRATKDSGR